MTNINVIQYTEELKKQTINSIRLLEVDVARKFDEIIFIMESLIKEKTDITPEVESDKNVNS